MREQTPLWLHRFAVFTAVATFILIFVGGLVTSTGSGLAVPDWPLSFGQVFPPMVGGVLYEHGHRMVATTVGILMVTLMFLLSRWEARSWVRWLARAAVLAVVLQGMLGGLTVLLRLPTLVSVTHACLAQAFFCLTVVLAVCTGPAWYVQHNQRIETASPSLRLIAILTTIMIYVQLILGAWMRHTGAGLAIPDFPLAFGRLIPPFESQGVVIHFIHRLGAVAVTFGIGWTVSRILSQHPDEPRLRRPALLMTGLLLIQLALGAATIWTQRSVVPMTAHVAVGAAVLATSLLLTLRAYRLINPAVAVHGQDFFSEQVTT